MPDTFTPEQIAQILEEFFKVVGTRQYIGARYVPIFGRKGEDSIEWDNTAPYEPLTIVLYQGNSYTSRQYVPAGVEITNQEFWAITGNYNAQVEQYRRETAATREVADNALAAANAAQTDIDTLLPKAAFSETNTVKQYIDTTAEQVKKNVLEVGYAKPYSIGCFFDNNEDTNCYLFSTLDGKSVSRISNVALFKGRDPSMYYANGRFYIAVTRYSIPCCHFVIYDTTDFVNFNMTPMLIPDVPTDISAVWAPEWFIDDDNIYIIATVMTDNNAIGKPYILTMDASNPNSIVSSRMLNTPDGATGSIDTCLVKHFDTYYAFAKKVNDADVADGHIWQFSSSDLSNWSLVSTDVIPNAGFRLEAPTIAKFDNLYYLYVDCYTYSGATHVTSYTYYATSSDCITWSSLSKLDSIYPTRHGGFLTVDDVEGCEIIRKYAAAFAPNNAQAYDMNLISQLNQFNAAYDNSNLWECTMPFGVASRGVMLSYAENGNAIAVTGELESGSRAYFEDYYNMHLPAGMYHLSGCPSGGSGSTYELFVSVAGKNYNDYGNGAYFVVPSASSNIKMHIAVYANVENLAFKPTITLVNFDHTPTFSKKPHRTYLQAADDTSTVINNLDVKGFLHDNLLTLSGQLSTKTIEVSGWKSIAHAGVYNRSGGYMYGMAIADGNATKCKTMRIANNSDVLQIYLQNTDSNATFNAIMSALYEV